MSLEAIEAECAAVATAPRVSLADIEGQIANKHFMRGDCISDAMATLSVCFLVMRNGFIVVGKSAPASPENFNAELGRKLAYEDAIRQLWPLMGFALRQKLSEAA